jgi:hypothetical protein
LLSSTLIHPTTERFTADVHHHIAANDLEPVHLTKDQSKDDTAKAYLAGHDDGDRVVFVDQAQQKTTVWPTRPRRFTSPRLA